MAKVQAEKVVTLAPIQKKIVQMTIAGVSPLVQHAWSEKAKRQMREKQGGIKTKTREIRDPEKEGFEAAYRTAKGKYGIPVTALKKAIVTAAHKDLGVDKTLVRKSVFIRCDDPKGILEMKCDEPTIQEDMVRVGSGSADLRYRPYFYRWSVPDIQFEIDAELMNTDKLAILVDRAGFGVGIGEMRPEKDGDLGRFEIDMSKGVKEKKAV